MLAVHCYQHIRYEINMRSYQDKKNLRSEKVSFGFTPSQKLLVGLYLGRPIFEWKVIFGCGDLCMSGRLYSEKNM